MPGRFLTCKFILLLVLAALSVSASENALYKSYLLPESLSNISQHDSGTAISTRRCALRCMKDEECYGFTYDLLTKNCSVETCVNPNLYAEESNDDYDFYIDLKVLESFSKLLARYKSAKLSSVRNSPQAHISHEAGMAVDGIYEPINGFSSSMAHSNKENRPWWRVDLGDIHCVWAVNILNRFGNVEASRRSINTEVTVAMVEEDIEFTGSNREVLCKYVDGYLNQYYTLITCDQPISGRFVQILFNATTILNLCEIEVHGY